MYNGSSIRDERAAVIAYRTDLTGGNAFVVDVWTQSDYRNQGIATTIMRMLIEPARQNL